MTTIGTKIARAKELAAAWRKQPWKDQHRLELGDLCPYLAIECEQLQERLVEVEGTLKACNEMRVKHLAEVERLQKLVEERPHDRSCRWINPQLLSVKEMNSGLYNCDCWKSRLHLPE